MIAGVGTDLVAIGRMERLWQRYGDRLSQRILTPRERDSLNRSPHPGCFLATRFAAKEAAAKAAGTGIRRPFTFQNLEITRRPGAAPELAFRHAAAVELKARGVGRCHLSLSDEAGYALAFVVLEREA